MNKIESNKHAWSKISKDHYNHFKSLHKEGNYQLNQYIQTKSNS